MKYMRLQTLMNKPELSSLLWLGINEDYKKAIEPYLAVYYGTRFLGVDFDEYDSEVQAVSVWQSYFARRCIVFCHNKWKLGNIPEPDSTSMFDGFSTTSTTTSKADKTTDTTNTNTGEATTNTTHNGDRTDTNEHTDMSTRTDTNSHTDTNKTDVTTDVESHDNNKSVFKDTANTTSSNTDTLTGKQKANETSNSETNMKGTVDTFERYRAIVEFYSKVFPLEEFLNKFDNIFLSCYDILREEEIL